MDNVIPIRRCCFCGKVAENNYSIYATSDMLETDEELDLCDACGRAFGAVSKRG